MTTPDSFEYNDDSVVARVSVDIPSQSVSDISQLTSAMGAMRTELEAIARAQSDWLGYLQQMPVIVEQSNQAIRNQITLMERMSYLQNEIGSSGGGGGGAAFSSGGGGGGSGGGSGGGGGGGGGYSTAARAGYENPFEGMTTGVGGRGGGGPTEQQVQEQIQGQDPRVLANMAAARGMGVNPATIGMIGGVVAGALGGMGGTGGGGGQGAPSSGSGSPQQGNAKRTAGGPPDPGNGGQPTDSQGQNEPGEPGKDDPAWRQFTNAVMNEIKAAGGVAAAGGVGGILGKATKIGAKMGAGKFLKGAGGKTLLGMGAIGAAGVAAHQVQNIGEDITEYQQLGSVRGGDYMTGAGMELENRIRALDPFVNLPQTREAMQSSYSAGFMGEDAKEVQSMAITNFKELGVSMQDTARMMQSAMVGKDYGDKGSTVETRSDLDAVLNTMKELSADGGASFPERQQQLARALEDLVGAGMDASTVERGELQLQEGYGDSRTLSKSVSGIAQGVMGSPTLSTIAAQRAGITGIVASALPAALNDAGFSQADILDLAAGEMANSVNGIPERYNRIGTFWDLMNQQGANIPTYRDAEELYDRVSGGQKPSQKGAQKVKDQGTQRNHQTNWNPVGYLGDVISPVMNAKSLDDFKNIPGDMWAAIKGDQPASGNARRSAEMFGDGGRNAAPKLPNDPGQATPSGRVTGEGRVTGNVTITVDQAGRVTAPPTIQLSGLQKLAQAGHGSSQMNNTTPGDSHSMPPLAGGR